MRPPKHDQGKNIKTCCFKSAKIKETDELPCIYSELSACIYFKINISSLYALPPSEGIYQDKSNTYKTYITVITCNQWNSTAHFTSFQNAFVIKYPAVRMTVRSFLVHQHFFRSYSLLFSQMKATKISKV